jgi:hypothetical protein
MCSIAGVADKGNNLSRVLLLPAINYRRCQCYRRFITAGVIVTSDKLIAGVMGSMKIRNRALYPMLIANISTNFRKNLKWPQIGYSRDRGKMILWKNLKSKISCQTPFNTLCDHLNSKSKLTLIFSGAALLAIPLAILLLVELLQRRAPPPPPEELPPHQLPETSEPLPERHSDLLPETQPPRHLPEKHLDQLATGHQD